MKILVATGLFPPEIGGPATYSKLLLEELPKRGIEVTVLPFREVRRLPKLFRHLAYAWKVFRLGKSSDLIYAQDPVSVGLPVMIACFFLRRSYWLKVVGDYAWEQGSQRFGVKDFLDDFSLKNNYSFSVRVLKRIQKKVADRAEKIIVPSLYLKKIVSNWGVDSKKIKVIYNSFDAPAELPSKEELRKKLSFKEPVLVTVGRLVPWKGFELLIELMKELEEDTSEPKLFIVGDGPDKKKLEEKINQLNLNSRVILTGRLNHETLLEYLKAADLFVLNTSYEGFSHQLLEVMWTETPIVTTGVGGNLELIENKKTGLLVDYNDRAAIKNAIKKLLADSLLAQSLARAAKEKVGEFTKRRMVEELVNEFKV